jgi:hypothetical protein
VKESLISEIFMLSESETFQLVSWKQQNQTVKKLNYAKLY